MQFFSSETGAPQPWREVPVTAPLPSAEPRPRGAWVRPDPDFPGFVIVEVWTGDQRLLGASRMAEDYYEFKRNQIVSDLDVLDPVQRYIRAI